MENRQTALGVTVDGIVDGDGIDHVSRIANGLWNP